MIWAEDALWSDPDARSLGRNPRRLAVPAALAVLLLVSLLACACSNNRFEEPRIGTTQRGIASWYGEPFHGRKTASGEVYDMHQLTAAHKELPLGTVVDVENLENGRTVRVRVNDRGPFIRGRVIDLSYAAAREIGLVGPGTARILLEVVELGQGRAGPAWTSAYTVQVGAYRKRSNAVAVRDKIAAQLGDDRPTIDLVSSGDLHKVQVGRFRHRADAVDLHRVLQRMGYKTIIVPSG